MSQLHNRGKRSPDPYRIIAAILVPFILSACAVDEEDTSALRVRSVGIVLGLTGDPTTDRTLPNIADPMAQLGMKLFFSKALETFSSKGVSR